MSDKLLYLEIVTPAKIVFSGNVKSITVPGELGSFQILFNHAPIISNLTIGEIKFEDEHGNKFFYASSSGFLMVFKNRVTIVSDSIQSSSEINVREDSEKLRLLKEEIKERRKTGNVEELETKIRELENRIKVAERVSIK